MTGSAHRLGKAIAVGLAEAGFQIAIHYNGSSQAAQETQTELLRICPGHFVLKADLSDVNAGRELVAAASRHHGRLDLLVHSASPWHEGPIEAVTPGEWDDVFAVGPRAGFFLAQAAFPHLRENRGAIVLISDVAATQAWPSHVPHAVAKAAFKLKGVARDSQQPVAFIDDRTVGLGEEVAGYKLVEIGVESVTLLDPDGQRHEVKLYGGE